MQPTGRVCTGNTTPCVCVLSRFAVALVLDRQRGGLFGGRYGL